MGRLLIGAGAGAVLATSSVFGMGAASAATIGGNTTITGTQVVTAGCQKTTVYVTASITGVQNDGDGKDEVVYTLWDDGSPKAVYHLQVPVGTTVRPTVVLSFSGLYGLGAPGVGVEVTDPQQGTTLVDEDPFYPEDATGDCDVSAPPTATVVPTSTTPTSTSTSTTPTSTSTSTTTTSSSTTTTPSTTRPTTTSTTTRSATHSTTVRPSSTTSRATGPVIQTDHLGGDGQNRNALLLGGGAAGIGAAFLLGSVRRLRRR